MPKPSRTTLTWHAGNANACRSGCRRRSVDRFMTQELGGDILPKWAVEKNLRNWVVIIRDCQTWFSKGQFFSLHCWIGYVWISKFGVLCLSFRGFRGWSFHPMCLVVLDLWKIQGWTPQKNRFAVVFSYARCKWTCSGFIRNKSVGKQMSLRRCVVCCCLSYDYYIIWLVDIHFIRSTSMHWFCLAV